MKNWIISTAFSKYPQIHKFRENLSSEDRVTPYGRGPADMKQRLAFRNSLRNAPNNITCGDEFPHHCDVRLSSKYCRWMTKHLDKFMTNENCQYVISMKSEHFISSRHSFLVSTVLCFVNTWLVALGIRSDWHTDYFVRKQIINRL